MAVQEQFENLHRLVDELKAGHAPTATAGSGQQAAGSKEPENPPVPAAEKAPACKSMTTNLEQVEACGLRMLWMSQLGNNVQDIADSLRWNPPQSMAEEQEMLECVRKIQAQEKLRRIC